MVTRADESDPLSMGADGHSNNTGKLLAIAEALRRLWLKDTELSSGLSPIHTILPSSSECCNFKLNATQGTSQVQQTPSRSAVLIELEKGKHWQLYLDSDSRGSSTSARGKWVLLLSKPGHTVRYLGTRERRAG